ncbi:MULTISPECIES: hypothetical protein [unclassified Campylobacter]|nr:MULTISPECIES: hypothetical protein [unclassified Campylobacter]MBT0879731.1 hypothetical protein [Campylobacter sp. 2018MI27]MBT0884611.1 hypothetical protein [Campylobacter sp. 2018MI10]
MKKLFSSVILLLALSSVIYAAGHEYKKPVNHCTITWYGKLYCSSNIND